MSIFDKLKNALFEEEYVEVEEKPKANKTVKPSKPEKSSFRNTLREKQKNKEKPFAKKIVLPEKRDVVVSVADEEDEVIKTSIPVVKEAEKEVAPAIPVVEEHNDFKFMDDDDFKVDDYKPVAPKNEPQIVRVIEKDEENSRNLYQGGIKSDRVNKPYGIDDSPRISVHEYGTYERKDERGYFKPSPIISPIYGILDKNYKKDDIVTRKEVRLTSNYAKERLNVDDVRKKAYGDLSDAIESVAIDNKEVVNDEPRFIVEEEVPKKEDSLVVDLTSDEEKPSVKEVTMGDAVEYFQDLGLEYNVDYVDAAKKTTSRRSEKVHEEVKVEKKEEPKEEKITKEMPVIEEKEEVDDDNLFDLIDSMYRDNE